jgi:thiamine-monophosphate kinase
VSTRPPSRPSAEDELITRYFAPLARHPGALGLRDDAAVFKPPTGYELVITADAIVAGTHFFPDDPPETVARKALRVNLSDLAAKGAEPAAFLLALGLPDSRPEWLAAFAESLGADADTYACPLLGGDTVKTTGPLFVSITAFGTLPRGTMVHRSGARAGDVIMVTGTIGDAALGLQIQRGTVPAEWKPERKASDYLVSRYWVPQPRTTLAGAVRTHASAAMDVSDGLAGDVAKLCRVSGVSAELEVATVPLSPAAQSALRDAPALLANILGGGDDYEILCTVPPDKADAFRAAAAKAKVPVAPIGRIFAGNAPPRFHDEAGHAVEVGQGAFSHF